MQFFDGEANWPGLVSVHWTQICRVMSMPFIFGDD